MSAPAAERIREREPLPIERRARPPLRPEPPPPSRTEGIVQAILVWLDGQL